MNETSQVISLEQAVALLDATFKVARVGAVVIGMDGQILKRGSDLRQVLRVLERKLIRAVD